MTRLFGNPLIKESMQDKLSNLQQSVQRQERQMDSFNKQLSVVANGKLQIAYDGTANFNGYKEFTHGLGYAPIYLCYYNLSTEPGKWQECDDHRYNSSGYAELSFTVFVTQEKIGVEVISYPALPTFTANFSFFLLKEPAQETV